MAKKIKVPVGIVCDKSKMSPDMFNVIISMTAKPKITPLRMMAECFNYIIDQQFLNQWLGIRKLKITKVKNSRDGQVFYFS